MDAENYTYIADSRNYRIRLLLDPPNGLIVTSAGDGTDSYSGDNGPVTAAQIGRVYDIALDRAGNLYIAEGNGHRVRRVSPQGIITTVAGNGTDGYSGDGGPATSAQLRTPSGMAVDGAGNLYIADRQAHCVRRVSPDGIISTFAGTGAYGYSGDGGPPTSARLWVPWGLALDSAGNLYIADSANDRIRRVSPSTPSSSALITTVAGNGTPGYSGDGGLAISAQLESSRRVAVDELGNLYIAQYQTIRRVSPGGIINTIAGTGSCCFSGDGGQATLARLNVPQGMAFDRGGNLYIADAGNHRIRRVSPAGIINTVAGTGAYGYSGDGGPAMSALLSDMNGVAIDGTGSIYLGTDAYAVRKLTPGACQASATPVTFTAAAAGGPLTLNIQAAAGCAWSIAGLPAWITASSISGAGPTSVTLTVAANPGAARSVTITAAGMTVVIGQAASAVACVFALSPAGQGFTSAGGSGALVVSTTPDCAWTASTPVTWVAITSGSSGSGSATVNYQVLSNLTASSRSAALTVAGLQFTVEQQGPDSPGLVSAGTMSQVASGGTWKTTFTLFNNGSASALARLSFTGGNGAGLILPLTFPQTGLGPILASTIERTLDAGAVLVVESEGPDTQEAQQGWAQLLTNGNVTGFAIFRQRIGEREQEAVVPLETRNSQGYVLALDNTNGIDTGVAVASLGSQGGALTVIIKDDRGGNIQTSPLNLPVRGHRAFVLNSEYPATASKRGTVEFRAPAGGQISVLGLRFNRVPFTSMPVWAH